MSSAAWFVFIIIIIIVAGLLIWYYTHSAIKNLPEGTSIGVKPNKTISPESRPGESSTIIPSATSGKIFETATSSN